MDSVKGIIVVVLIVIIGCVILSLTCCNKDTPAEPANADTALVSDMEDSEDTVTSIESDTVAETEDENGGGNPGNYTELKVTVSENRYYYDNSEISFDDFVEMIDGLDTNCTVIIHDDFAADKAFESITSLLKEREIPYTVE
ncbi:MAG: hypothetical protein NC078_11600 [Ruminococcus sp.]|nr:hypothetical protein [Ruminococcus sp.]